MEKHKLKNNAQPYLWMVIFGLLAGILTRLTDFLPADSIWGFQSIATLFGFWMVTVTLVICSSSSNGNAAARVFVYLFCMNIGFYGLKYLYRFFAPNRADEGFQTNLFLLYTLLALACAAISFVLYFWNRDSALNSVLYALPVGGLAAETIGMAVFFFANRTYLFQLLFDLAGGVAFGLLFFRKAKSKPLYAATAAAVAALGYLLFYKPFL
ncbi:hypothetical protein [Agathobaculum sp.]|uniref:hypothetical protein n=1 Tax=Agathobaculum sp. TaxID=2048138 RepID=UPI002A7F26A3|nr:hypothetical protein [Agathobaculum sp.]MDY3618425.1 hypothetical protein [Agathobaculum sp.]